ncbi:MAG: hypothetical protein VB095_08560 [Anaerovorax sp.]|nr:hypothetical protein [Anaerovorax sp.]
MSMIKYFKNLCEEKQEAALRIVGQDKIYFLRQNFLMNTEYDQGLKDGIEMGLYQGIKQGADRASVQLREEMAEKLIRFGLTASEVCNITGVKVKPVSNN